MSFAEAPHIEVSTFELATIAVASTDQTQLKSILRNELLHGSGCNIIVTLNLDFLRIAKKNEEFRKICLKCFMVVPDGFGITSLVQMKYGAKIQRVTGNDIVKMLVEDFEDIPLRIAVVGSGQEIAIGTEAVLRYVPSKRIAMLILFSVGTLFAVQSMLSARNRLKSNAHTGEQLFNLKGILDSQTRSKTAQDEIVIMTRNPWEVYHTTKYKCVQIPNDGLETIVEVAKRYKATFLLLPAPRMALEDIYDETTRDDRFQFVAAVRDVKGDSPLKLFRIRAH